MKLAFLMMMAVFNPAFAGDLIQTNSQAPGGLFSTPPPAAANQQGDWFSGKGVTNWSSFGLALTNAPILNLKADPFQFDSKLSLAPGPAGLTPSANPKSSPYPTLPCTGEATRLKPGVYKTLPYTCLVLIPGPYPDKIGTVEKDSRGLEKMPTLLPQLKLVPTAPAAK